MLRYQSTTYQIGAEAIHHHTGILSTKDTDIRLDRIEAIDVHQGPLQRLFGVFAVDVQTGAAGKGGEISLPALTPDAVAELRAARPQAAATVAPTTAPEGPSRRIAGRELAIAALTAGQLGIVAAGPGRRRPDPPADLQRAARRGGDPLAAAHRRPRSPSASPGCSCSRGCSRRSARSSPSAASPSPATATGCGFRRGLVQRREATVPVRRVRAVRVVEGIFRRPFGLPR